MRGYLFIESRTARQKSFSYTRAGLSLRRKIGSWSIPKCELDGEDPFAAARREFEEETGFKIAGEFVEIKPVKQKGGKLVYAWAVEADVDAS